MQLSTRWGRSLDPDRILPEYPREQLRRDSYQNLNGTWEYTITSCTVEGIPSQWAGTILVPFSPETALSQVRRQLQPDEYLWYRRTLPKPNRTSPEDRVLIHLGAVDQTCIVYVNGHAVQEHTGGYLPITADITDCLRTDEQPDELVLRVRDVSDTSYYARGKQKLQNGGMYYMATSGIWQTVWMETVPESYIRDLVLHPLVDEEALSIRVVTSANVPAPVSIDVFTPGIYTETDVHAQMCAHTPEAQHILTTVQGTTDTDLHIPIPDASLWDPEHPWLYPIRIHMGDDEVTSYFAMRCIAIEPDAAGLSRICLNHRPLFLRGVLDQGYWPESYYTPPSDEAILFDLTEMKKFGFNMVRKHAKIEPDRWYYHCDRLGLLVWQDMVNGGYSYDDSYVTLRPNLRNWKNTTYRTYDTTRTGRQDPESREEFRREVTETVAALQNHPSIFSWTLFNESWGQFDTESCTHLLRSLDPTRPIDSTSGWFDQNQGDYKSVHNYFFPFRIYPEQMRAFVLSEFGGLPMLLTEHSTCKKLYGYGRKYKDSESLTQAYRKLNEGVEKKIPKGLCATVYTQWTDIEDEVNGVYTWDREVKKIESTGTEDSPYA